MTYSYFRDSGAQFSGTTRRIRMTVINTLCQLVGSLGFLLYGMRMMSDGVQKSSGEKLQRTLGHLTGNSFYGLMTGMAVTMIIQSSGATTAMVVSFVNAGLLTLKQSLGVIYGANIGTTITAWIVSFFGFNFKIADFAIPVFGVGFFLTMSKKSQTKNIGEAIMGFGALFLGLSWLSDVFSFDPSQLGFLEQIQDYGILSILISFVIGIAITALMHSSSAFSAIVITMAYNNIITWETAAAMTLGSNIGSTIDAVLASIGTSPDARRSAVVHVLFNTIGTIVALIFFTPLLNLVTFLSAGANIAIRISVLHTVFKAITTLLFMPFANQVMALARLFVKDNGTKQDSSTYRLDFQEAAGVKDNIAAHIVRLEKEISDMANVAGTMVSRIKKGIVERNQDFIDSDFELVKREEDYCDQMHEQIVSYILNCEKLPVTGKQRSHLARMIQITEDLESMTDECLSVTMLIKRSIDKEMEFVKDDMDKLVPYVDMAQDFLTFVCGNINRHLDKEKLAYAANLENQIDAVRKELKKLARKRLEKGADVKTELLYIDIVRQIEKIGDHAFSISEQLSAE